MSVLDKLKELTPHIYRLRVLAITVAVIVLPFIIYSLFYVRSQTRYFTDRSFRNLSLMSSQIAAKVEMAGLVLKNTSDKFVTQQLKDKKIKINPDPAREQQNLKDLKDLFKTLKDDGPQVVPVSIRVETLSDKVSPLTVSLTAVRNEADTSWLYLDYVSDKISPKTVVRVQGKVDLNSLVQPLMRSPSSIGFEGGPFENILISEADTAGVIFQNDPTQVRLASLDKLTAIDDTGKSIDLKEIGKTSSVVDVALAGSNYKLFSHPISLALPSNTANASTPAWIVSGLIRADHFRYESWSISGTILIIFGFIAILLVLSWPFLKLVLTGQKDRLRTADIYFLIFSTMVGLAVLTSFAFYGYLYLKAEHEIDSQLKDLAGEIKTNFQDELTAALDQLNTLSNNCALLRKLDPKACVPNDKDVPQGKGIQKEKNIPKEKDIYQSPDLEKTNVLTKLLPQAKYPYFDTAVWLDQNGMQRAKWTIKGNTTQYISVSKRDYFNNIRLGHYYDINGTKFWLEPIVSRTTGRNEVEISKAAADPNWITAFDTQLISLMHPVLPASFGFAIIGNDGKVLFHSDEAHDLGENFFQECDENGALRSAVTGRTDKTLGHPYLGEAGIRYLGEDHSMLITTIPNFPDWSLIVFRNKEPLRSAFLELVSLVSCLFLIYCIVLLIASCVFYLVNLRRNKRRSWLWPSQKKTDVYIQSFIFLLGLSLISVKLAIDLHGDKLVVTSAVIGFLSACIFLINLRYGKALFRAQLLKKLFRDPAPREHHHLAYVLNLTFLLLVIAILPAAAFFKYAYETELKLFFKHAQFTTVAALLKRDERIRNQYLNIQTVPNNASEKSVSSEKPKSSDPGESVTSAQPKPSEFTKKRLNEVTWDIYDNFFYATTHEESATRAKTCTPDSTNEWFAKLITLLPVSSQTSIERRGLFTNALVHDVCEWETDEAGRLVLHLNSTAFSEIDRPWRHLATNFHPLESPGFVWFGIFALLFLPFLWFVNFIVRKVFLLDVYKPTSFPLGNFLTTKIDRNLFVVVDAHFIEKATSRESNLYLKDLRTIATTPDWVDKFTDNLPGVEHAIGLDNFDFSMSDPHINVKKLELVENLLQKKRTLMIFSSVEPSQFHFKISDNGHNNGEQDGRWAGIISQFFTEYAEDNGNPIQFKRQVVKERRRILSMDLKGRSRQEIKELICTLCTECAPKGPLQKIGLQILAEKSFITLTRQHLLNRILRQAQPYYTHLWNSCSINEKLTLSHLAQDRLLNHRDPDIEPLLRRELIVRNEDVHLMNDSFREFVKSAAQRSLMAEHYEKAKQDSWWHSIKRPLLAVTLAFTVFLFVTQREFYTSSLALLTAITTIIPALFKLLSLFQSDSLGRPSSQN